MHPGLLLDKPHDPKDWWPRDSTVYVRERLAVVSRAAGDAALLTSLRARRAAGLPHATCFKARTSGPLSLHLARANAFENAGICLHPLYGFAYLPGSGLKGMARAFAKLAGEPESRIDEVFGPTVERQKDSAAGVVVFHEAWPTSWPGLAVDIVNCHHRHYYDGQGENSPPEDWEDPVPVNFLTVERGAEFEFAISPRDPSLPRHRDLCAQAVVWLKAALVSLGAGAKTNAGYGRFVVPEDLPRLPGQAVFEAKLTLVTPAFLAGALQEADDCDLRPATLRGLLRWWWRTLHAGRLSLTDLRRLENFLWGTTEKSAAISIELLAPSSNPGSLSFNQDDIRTQNGIQKAPGPKVSQGFFYLAYGMQESRRQGQLVKPARQYLPHGCCWTIRLTATSRKDSDGRAWTSEQLLSQARAALFALVHCGGVGAKERRGYGSLSIEASEPPPSTIRAILDLAALPEKSWAGAFRSPSLTHLAGGEPLEVPLPGNEPWFALDQLGAAYQEVAADEKHNAAKMALGLPRKINDPKGNDYIPHPHSDLVPDGKRKQDKPNNFRHASPLHFKVLQRDGRYFVRATAFIDPYLPDPDRSAKFLSRALTVLRVKLDSRAAIPAPIPKRQPSAPPTSLSRPQTISRKSQLAVKQKTTGVLVEQSNKGTWKIREASTGEVGPIQNSKAMPADLKPGDTVHLIVKVSKPGGCAFDWIKEA